MIIMSTTATAATTITTTNHHHGHGHHNHNHNHRHHHQHQHNNVQSQQQQEPYRILESPESVTYKEFELLDVTATDGFKVSYRFPRINEATKTLVELVVKCTLKIDDNRNQNRITIQPPSNGSIQFKNVEVSE